MQSDIAIIGGGLAGMTLAALCGAAGFDVICIDQSAFEAQKTGDERTTAISYGSRKILEEAGIWAECEREACPIRDIRILDGAGSRMLLNFLSEEVEGKDFGWIVENSLLRAACRKRLEALKNVTVLAPVKATGFDFAPPPGGRGPGGGVAQVFWRAESAAPHPSPLPMGEGVLEASLVVGADGRGSPLREALNIETHSWSYNQRALVAIIGHEHPHDNVAVEHFYPAGPFAMLPMTDGADGAHRSSIVFTEHGPEEESLAKARPEAFLAALEARVPENYGRIALRTGPQAYPLGLIHAARYTAPRAALIADAAHGMHPIAGQGLNLGYRDVKALADLLREAKAQGTDIGGEALLERYQMARRTDVTAMLAVTDGLVRLFSNDFTPVKILRKLGLRAVARLPAAKRFFMKRAMGE